MLSSQAPQLSPRHRRQNSTPTSINSTVKATYEPAQFKPQHSIHRRGLSIDMAMNAHGPIFSTQQENGTVSTNQGPELQQNMRAAQMPASPRPGLDEFIRSQEDGFESQWSEFQQPGVLDPSLSTLRQPDQQLLSPMKRELDQQHRATFLDIMDPFAMLENRTAMQKQPQTPSKQRTSNYPLTPITEARHNIHMLPKSVQPSPTRYPPPEIATNAQSIAMKRGGSCQDSFAMTRQLSDAPSVPSPPGTAPLRSSATFDLTPVPDPSFLDIRELNLKFTAGGDYSSSNYSPTTNRGSPSMSSFQSSPDLAPMNLFGELAEMPPSFVALGQPGRVSTVSDDTTPTRKVGSSKKSSSSKVQSDSESTFNPMDYMHNDTGITEDEINAHIQGPDADGKYYCLHEDCLNRQSSARKENVFGRKENIRAHVQTHLEDRRFECDVCYKRFVRPNDLKRHWNIHLNKRDFKCVCNAAFNRHDALKRHRERSEYCESGGKRGIPGSPKKEEKKRGRPKKIAPTESEERRERKALIRRQVLKKKQASAASSVASSHPSPPADFDAPELQRSQPTFNGYSPAMGSFTPPASPGAAADDVFSPLQSQAYCTPKASSMSPPPTRGSITASLGLTTKSVTDPDFGMDFLGEPVLPNVNSPSKSNASQYGTPPELELSSSSPSAHLVDFSFTDSIEQSSQATENTDFLDDMMKKTTNDAFDNMFSFIANDTTADTAPKTDDMEIFRDSLQDEFYWAQA